MSLNKSQNYDKYGNINFQYKAKKLGLSDAIDGKCCFISETGDKQIIVRDIVASDLPQNAPVLGGTQTFLVQRDTKIIQVDTINTPLQILNTASLIGNPSTIDTRNFNEGDFIEFNYEGFYGTRASQDELLRGITIVLNDTITTKTLQLWDLTGVERFLFPQTVNNTGGWNMKVRIMKGGPDSQASNTGVNIMFTAGSPYNINSTAQTTCAISRIVDDMKFDTSNFSVDIKFKPGSSSNDVSPNFQIYNLWSTGSVTTGILDVQAE